MPRIKVLSEILQNKIAAGEVVERPASIVKELIENSLDAESTDIRVDVQKGGKRKIRVSDDGIGMEKEDVLLCFQKHATSKIADISDLHTIVTMGFRGEALSSISAVSKVQLKTAHRGAQVGTLLEIAGGVVDKVEEASAIGTTIEVRDLFYNTPVRKKFLKTDHTELYHIIDVVTRSALINPDISYSLTEGNREIINLHKAGSPRERIAQIFGMTFLEGLMEVQFTDEHAGVSLFGCVSREDNVRKRRSNQYLFVNKRPIMDAALRHAIYKAYEGYLDRDAHPVFILHMSLDPNTIDVNVHPTKKEIRFLDKEHVYDTILNALREALKESHFVGELPREITTMEEFGTSAAFRPKAPLSRDQRYYHSPADPLTIEENNELLYTIQRNYHYIGDVFIAFADTRGLCIVDHHAAHERVLYERLQKGIGIASSAPLFPRQVRLGAKDYSVLLKYTDLLVTMGFVVEDFGSNTVIVRSLPDQVNEEELEGLLSDIASSIMDVRSGSPMDEVKDGMAKRIACHSSLRGKTVLGKEQTDELLRDLDAAEDPHHCPHGRPTRLYFSLDDLRKMFERM